MESGKFIQKVKYGCELAGFEAGNARMPLQPLTTEEKASFRKAFELAQGEGCLPHRSPRRPVRFYGVI